jgi:hypothetical protein
MANPTHLYVGPREAVMAEVGTGDYYEGKYLLQFYGEEEWGAEGVSSKKELRLLIKEYRQTYPGIQVIWL